MRSHARRRPLRVVHFALARQHDEAAEAVMTLGICMFVRRDRHLKGRWRRRQRLNPMSHPARAPLLVMFDFDWSLIDDNSDTRLVQELGVADVYQENRHLQWTVLMDLCFRVATGERGKGPANVERACRALPLHRDVARAIRDASDAGVVFALASDANSLFIRHVLEQHGLSKAFGDRVLTNPAEFVGGAGGAPAALRVRPFCGRLADMARDGCEPSVADAGTMADAGPEVPWESRTDRPLHGCPRCPRNQCKADILREVVQGLPGPLHRIVYVGDGSNDVCPCLAGGKGLIALARRHPGRAGQSHAPSGEPAPALAALYSQLREIGCEELDEGALGHDMQLDRRLGESSLPRVASWVDGAHLARLLSALTCKV